MTLPVSTGSQCVGRTGCPAALRAAALCGLLVVGSGACVYDPENQCSDGQVLYQDGSERCVCDSSSMWTPQGCVPCGKHETAGPGGCVCVEGFVRTSEASACEPAPKGLGTACDPEATPCVDATYDYCFVDAPKPGYCTTQGCTGDDDCPSGYGCDSSVSPSVCRMAPDGLGKACESDADCEGTEAPYCDTFASHTCLVPGCTVTPDNCFRGYECCDLSAYGMGTLCVPQGGCQT
ncbi:MAG: hypothetical protein JW940_05105 [Polyangiaceae bacterium]|nr:hypothetical protein [Polyangiaceae bacterium]